jgi:DNA polymerase I-like protein with 3'-5' exonuclease and polymerase domains
MMEVNNYLQKNHDQAYLLLQVYDELVIESPKDLAQSILRM